MTPTARELDVFTCALDGIALIEASAGTGKTWNICGLYLRQLLEKDLPVSRLLVMTFTRAATAELSARIRARIVATLRALRGEVDADDDDPFVPALIDAVRAAGVSHTEMEQRLQGALAGFDEAAIYTIHGFCQRALADAPFAAGLPYVLEMGEDDSDLRLEVTQDFWRREVTTLDAALADYLLESKDSPEGWAQWLKEAQARPLARPMWDDPADNAAPDAGQLADAYDNAHRLWSDGRAVMTAIAAVQDGLNKTSYKPGTIETAHQQWARWLGAGDARLPLRGHDDKLPLFTARKLEIPKSSQKRGLKPPEHPFFAAAQTLLEAREQFDKALQAARMGLLRRFITAAGSELRQRKQRERRVAFDDILWNAYDALASGKQPWLGAALHTRYPVALIDEFQDTDPLQLEIFRRIYADAESDRHGSLFLVGDPKQAIYSFRGADLHSYLGARQLADARYTLDVNRRSSPALVAACNRLFSANPAVFMEEGLDFRPVQAHEPPQSLIDQTPTGSSAAALQLWRIPRAEDESPAAEEEPDAENNSAGGERLPRAQAIARAAAASAAEIARLLAAGHRGEIRIGERALAPADIAVLVRTHKEGARLKAALAQKGVGSVELSQSSVFASGEAEELERVLRAVAEPARERLVKTALATVLMGWDAVDLARLAGDDDELIRQFDLFAKWHDVWREHSFAVMLWRWMSDARVAERLLAFEDGERRLTNLLHLTELLQQEAGRASPANLLRALARRRAEGGGEDAQLRLESDRNLVQIVTVHRAKGLQYGIVFCPFLFDGYQRPNTGGPMRLWHDADGQVADWRHAAADEDDILQRIGLERDAETLRLIYVALTRAVHRCYLVVGCYAAKNSHGGVSHRESSRSLLNWMVAGAGRTAENWRAAKTSAKNGPPADCTPAEIDARWRGLVAASNGVIALAELPTGAGESLTARSEQLKYTAPRAPRVPHGWRVGSFSAMVSGATHEGAARDHDARLLPDPAPTSAADSASTSAPIAEDDILRFPRGAAAGDCIHAVFETLDFPRPETRAAAIDKALTAHPLPVTDTAEAARLPKQLTRLIDDVLATPLLTDDATLRLSTLSPSRRLTELGFYLPTPHLGTEALNHWLYAHNYTMPRLTARDLTGYLKGYIDLVFEHAGRYWILDWKSNHLGDTAAAYAPASLATAMTQHGYHLQHLLYTVALHRHLGSTLADYDYDHHFGGVLYLFVRGVRPGWQVEGVPAGVFRHRAAKAVIESLDALLGDR
jgi:exodeoxyribonuclease V beta subunit